MGETVSAGTQASARGLAKLAAFLANKGTFNGQVLLNEESYNDMMSEPLERRGAGFGNVTRFTKGGMNVAKHSSKADNVPSNIYHMPKYSDTMSKCFNDNRDGYCGWAGLGGSIF